MVPIPQKILVRKHEITNDFLDMLDQHIEDILAGRIHHTYKLKDFAARLSVSPAHLSNTIKLTTKRSLSELMEERLFAEAKRMLSETSMSIAQICRTLTFADVTRFTRFFNRFEGKTPVEYRSKFGSLELV